MRQSGNSFRAPLQACGLIVLLLSFIFSAAEAFTFPHHGIFQETRAYQRTPLFIPSFIGDRTLKLPRENKASSSQLWEALPLDEKGETTGGGDDNQDWFKMGQQKAKELRETVEDAEDAKEKDDVTDLEEEEDLTVKDSTNSIQEVAIREPSTALLEAQVLSQETARALIASAACIFQMKEEELKTAQTEIQNLREKLEKLEEREVLLEEEVALARSNQDQTVEQEQIIRESFQKLTSENKDIA